jgi:hypothetical protein
MQRKMMPGMRRGKFAICRPTPNVVDRRIIVFPGRAWEQDSPSKHFAGRAAWKNRDFAPKK